MNAPDYADMKNSSRQGNGMLIQKKENDYREATSVQKANKHPIAKNKLEKNPCIESIISRDIKSNL